MAYMAEWAPASFWRSQQGPRFVDSPLEGTGFELSVPGHDEFCWAPCREKAEDGSARFLLLGEPFHGTLRIYGFGGLRFLALLGGFCEPAVQLKDVLAPASSKPLAGFG
jgi:hypothetical protein